MKKIGELTNEEIHFRGMFMSLFIDIEFLLGDNLAKSLVTDEVLSLNILEFVNPKLLLDSKISMLINVLKKKYPKIHNDFMDDLTKLRKLGSLRNDFAHKRISVDIKSKTLNFIVLENSCFIDNPHKFKELEDNYEFLKHMIKRLNDMEKIIPAT